ncbi:glycosyltransferase [Pelobium manganitolerans]|nr:glycosyltransferase [Pelobium manganitolerans]
MMAEAVHIVWIILQIAFGFHLFFPLFLFLLSKVKGKTTPSKEAVKQLDFAVIITAYEETINLHDVVDAFSQQRYENYTIYLVADKCDVSQLHFDNPRVNVLVPPQTIGSNTGSHAYAFEHFKQKHDVVTIIDSDNIIDKNYLFALNQCLSQGFKAVQGLRAAKNLDSDYARLDAARDIYYHYYDGELLYNVGSSATLSGSAMAFDVNLYSDFLSKCKVSGAGFDKVLQAFLVQQDIRIAFCKKAVLLDQKTSNASTLVKQRSRWINTWFKYFKYGFTLLFKGLSHFSFNQLLFGLVLLRPPLFIFLILSLLALVINIVLGLNVWLWVAGFVAFIVAFFIALASADTDKRIYSALAKIPKFVFYQVLSLTKVRVANKISVATKHEK